MVIRALALLTVMAQPAAAQSLTVELNTAQDSGDACRISFLAENTLGADLSALVFEVVVLNTKGQVDRLTLLDFQDLPQGRKRVRQFDLPGVRCDWLAEVLVNAASTCAGEGISATACMDKLVLTSRVPAMEVSG